MAGQGSSNTGLYVGLAVVGLLAVGGAVAFTGRGRRAARRTVRGVRLAGQVVRDRKQLLAEADRGLSSRDQQRRSQKRKARREALLQQLARLDTEA